MSGTRVTGIVSEVRRRGTFGKNAQIQITIDPLRLHGASIGLRPARKGKEFKGSKTDRAAGTAGAGAIVLGPVGLAAGVFVKGKEVEIKKGDPMHTEVARTVTLHM
ncbi:MAG: hypothetical protein HY248_02695 [Fimbriimonas ginsengisoli]|nr:hypothetical protein [Fimbriimonas ginsengisoli]